MNTLSTRRPSRAEEARERALREVRDEDKPTVRLNVQVPKSLMRSIKVIAARNDRTVSEIVREFLEGYSREHSED